MNITGQQNNTLGYCKRCNGALGVANGHRPVPEGRTPPPGPRPWEWWVACMQCHVPDYDHPHQAKLDADAAALAEEKERSRRHAAPPDAYSYTVANHLNAEQQARERLSARVGGLEGEVAALRALVNEMAGNGESMIGRSKGHRR